MDGNASANSLVAQILKNWLVQCGLLLEGDAIELDEHGDIGHQDDLNDAWGPFHELDDNLGETSSLLALSRSLGSPILLAINVS